MKKDIKLNEYDIKNMEINIENSYIYFLKSGKELSYNPGNCETGAITLVDYNELK
jgi:hypothetical protein